MYDAAAALDLKEKAQYDLWLLRALAGPQAGVPPLPVDSRVELDKEQASLSTTLYIQDSLGLSASLGGGGRSVVSMADAIRPVTFVIAFKAIDTLVEWILEENQSDGWVTRSGRWTFGDKVRQLGRLPAARYPAALSSFGYVTAYIPVLYDRMMPFRHEVVHGGQYRVTNGVLKVTAGGRTVCLSRDQHASLLSVAATLVSLADGESPPTHEADVFLKYHLDQIACLHGMRAFRQAKPLRVHAVLRVPERNGRFVADLAYVKARLQELRPESVVVFDLDVILVKDGCDVQTVQYRFDEVKDLIELDITPPET